MNSQSPSKRRDTNQNSNLNQHTLATKRPTKDTCKVMPVIKKHEEHNRNIENGSEQRPLSILQNATEISEMTGNSHNNSILLGIPKNKISATYPAVKKCEWSQVCGGLQWLHEIIMSKKSFWTDLTSNDPTQIGNRKLEENYENASQYNEFIQSLGSTSITSVGRSLTQKDLAANIPVRQNLL